MLSDARTGCTVLQSIQYYCSALALHYNDYLFLLNLCILFVYGTGFSFEQITGAFFGKTGGLLLLISYLLLSGCCLLLP